uniref:Uncharacterized protein n=1 Tax=Zea mays TaxID=4577 RepID=B6TKA3_MAIZE|nr:hypothetical protein [Zea mays]
MPRPRPLSCSSASAASTSCRSSGSDALLCVVLTRLGLASSICAVPVRLSVSPVVDFLFAMVITSAVPIRASSGTSLPVGLCVAAFTSFCCRGLGGMLLWYLDRARLNSNESYCHHLRRMEIVALARRCRRSPSSSTPSPKP